MDLSVIILNYNTKNLLRECLRGVRICAPKISMEIVVVDNASSDGSAEMALAEFPEARVIRTGQNLGYAGGNNLGIRAATGRYIMIMNPDILLMPEALERLVAFMDANPKVGLAGPQLLNPDQTIQQSCYRFHNLMTPVFRRTFLGLLPFGKRANSDYLMGDFDHKSERDVDWLLGGAAIARREAVDEVGFLDTGFFLYFDDTDWCRRFWEKGWRVTYFPESKMVHFHQRQSSGGVMALMRKPTARQHVRSGVTYFRKYRGKGNPRLSIGR